jgi:4,5-dihydroxyphthalate decarboxylase
MPDSPPTMVFAAQRFDRSAALIAGRVRLDNVLVIGVPGGRTAVQGLLGGAFDAAEVPLARYVFWRDQGAPISAIPVFTDRLFSYPYIYTRPDAGINSLADLRGRRVVISPGYFSTPAFWHRAILQEEHDIQPQEIDWYTTGPDGDAAARIPADVKVTVAPGSLLGVERLLDGTGDCLMTARTAAVPPDERHRVTRLLPDAHARQRQRYRETGCFPILHVVGIRNDALAKRPGLATELCRACDVSKSHAYHILQDERMTALPFMREYLDETVALCGDDPWPYGLERNRAELDTFLGHAHSQGLTRRRLAVDELFDQQAAAYQFKARMETGSIVGAADGGWAAESVGLDASLGLP